MNVYVQKNIPDQDVNVRDKKDKYLTINLLHKIKWFKN